MCRPDKQEVPATADANIGKPEMLDRAARHPDQGCRNRQHQPGQQDVEQTAFFEQQCSMINQITELKMIINNLIKLNNLIPL